jgi:hypothetical protein
MVKRRWKEPTAYMVQTQEPKMKVSPWLNATIVLMRIEAVELSMRSSASVAVPREVPKVDERGTTEIDNSKEETRGTQFRKVRAAMCVIPYVLYVA